MSKPGLIALSGYARSGKDTVAEYLVKEHGYTRVAFADALRDALYALNPVVRGEYLYADGRGEDPIVQTHLQTIVNEMGWDEAKTEYAEIRELLQRLGTEVGRDIISPNVWVDIAMRKVAAIGGPVAITDLRFPNEYTAVNHAGGQVWRIERPGTNPVNAHTSETALDGHDFHGRLINAGTIEALHAEVELMFVDLRRQ